MKLFFWDFDEKYDPFEIKGFSKKKRRDFLDFFYKNKIDLLLKSFPNFSHGIVTNGDLKNQFKALELKGSKNLFQKEFSSSPFQESKILIENFSPWIRIYFKIPFTSNPKEYYINLMLSLSKPNEYMYKNLLINSDFFSKDCYVVGTSYKDFLAAKKSDMKTIYIRGWENKEDMKVQTFKEKPEFIINRSNMFKGLENIFKNIK